METVLPLLNYLRTNGGPAASTLSGSLALRLGQSREITCDAWLDLYEQAIAVTGDLALPLHVGASIQPSDYSILGFAAMSCPTLGDAIGIMRRYERLVQDVNATELVIRGQNAELQWLPYLGPIAPIFMQLALASWATLGRGLTGDQCMPFEAHFTFPQPANTDAYVKVFGRPARFQQAATKLVFDRDFLDRPTIFGDAQTNQLLVQKAEEQLLHVTESDFVHRVRQRISANLATGAFGVEAIAQELAISTRRLQQLLASDGSSFRKLMQDIQCQHAKAYLADPSRTLLEIAHLVGYAEQSPFQHAFKLWTGMTPGDYRRTVSAALSGAADR
ncbi:AraC family transcriptional regulator [Duganella sp. LX20W]|uniref:AraC family transcriptional regulator n=1 Tax=Rugamonas brunnea TaxID=2758569 RepID=A0A7W2ENW2_9BURK|nr:AraC family transcriptional regulator [Rugamonas brunnea]MBA5635942.1 AraC family transcriptional regulator [Rugamonas brunnea]